MKALGIVLLALLAPAGGTAVEDAPRQGVGSLDGADAAGKEYPLELRRLAVDATVRGDAAETRVEHVFRNATGETLQGTFRFPLPEDAVLVGLAMEVEGELVEGALVEREKAQRVYEQIVDGMRDPALLEWEGSRVFKLRVFPIEPQSEKRVVVRYVAPLERRGRGLRYVYPLHAPSDLPAFRLTLDGAVRWDATSFPARSEIALDVPQPAADAQREDTDDATYTSIRVRPDWSRIPAPPDAAAGPRRVLVLLDDSRSALESRPLQLQALAALLEGLRPADRFLLAASDIAVREHADAFVPATREHVAAALAFARGLEPDGASDVSLALRYAAHRASAEAGALEVVYVGDGGATWGETRRDALVAEAREQLGAAVFHAVAVGRGADEALLRALCGALGGRFEAPKRSADVAALASRLANARRQRVLRDVTLSAGEGDTVLPGGARALFEDDDWQVLVRSPKGAGPASVLLQGRTAFGPWRQPIAVHPAEGGYVQKRFGALAVDALEAAGAERDAIVRASLAHGVASRHTAFLVLESEEAFARFQIRRQQEREARVTGADLESPDDAPRLSPDQIQPGDPEVRVPAPADARAVTVTFPFGATKAARYEPELGAWTVRFLIGRDTPDGVYHVYVRVTHADGHVELLRLSYTVDTAAPAVSVTWREAPDRPGTYVIEAVQVASTAALSPLAGVASVPSATIVEDARRVDVQLPGGEVLPLGRTRSGVFRGYWKPRRPLTRPATLTVVAVDRALNRRASRVTLEPPAALASR
ncbi:MAG: VIT and VWA domain-containing protein [Vicinamibacteria bacterium]